MNAKERIDRLLNALGLSYREVAERLGVTASCIYFIRKRPNVKPRRALLARLEELEREAGIDAQATVAAQPVADWQKWLDGELAQLMVKLNRLEHRMDRQEGALADVYALLTDMRQQVAELKLRIDHMAPRLVEQALGAKR